MANAVLNELFGKKNKAMVQQATKKMVRSLKAADGNYFGRLMKIGFKEAPKKDDEGNKYFRFFWMVVLICDEQGNEESRGEQAYNTLDIKPNKKYTADEMLAKALECFDKLDYEAPDPSNENMVEEIDQNIAEILSEKPLVKININQPEGYDRKFVNLNGTVTVEEVEEALGHSLEEDPEAGGDQGGDDDPGLGDDDPDGGDADPVADEPPPVEQKKAVETRRTGGKRK